MVCLGVSSKLDGCYRSTVRSGVWGFPVAERPVLLRHLGQHDHDILGPNVRFGVEPFDDGSVELPLQFHRAPGIEHDVDDECVGGSVETEVCGIDAQRAGVVGGDDLEFVALRDVEDVGHRLVDHVPDEPAPLGFDGAGQVDSDERHCGSL
jgi:hypothetical protein